MVGIAVIFAYYIVMFLAESLTKGYYADPDAVAAGGHFLAAHMARWVPNIVLGSFGIARPGLARALRAKAGCRSGFRFGSLRR